MVDHPTDGVGIYKDVLIVRKRGDPTKKLYAMKVIPDWEIRQDEIQQMLIQNLYLEEV